MTASNETAHQTIVSTLAWIDYLTEKLDCADLERAALNRRIGELTGEIESLRGRLAAETGKR